jgi:AraC family transcriptional regulator, arabinose operon regulatory protein
MYISAGMVETPNSPAPPEGQLSTGLFRMRHEYSRWRRNGAPGWLIIYTVDGKGRFGYDGGELTVDPGDLVILAPRALNDYGLENKLRRWDLLWAYFFPYNHWHELLHWPEVAPGLMHLCLTPGETRNRVVKQIMTCHRLNHSPRRHREMFAMNALETALLYCDEANPLVQRARLDPRMLRAMEYMSENLARHISVPQVARHTGLSISRFSHLFRSKTGQTPHQFLQRERISRARQLLELTQQSVTEVAAETGFDDLFHFSRSFKRYVGVSPREYRARVLASEK